MAWEYSRLSHFYWLSDKWSLTPEPSADSVLPLLLFMPLFKPFLERRKSKDRLSPFNLFLCIHLGITLITQ